MNKVLNNEITLIGKVLEISNSSKVILDVIDDNTEKHKELPINFMGLNKVVLNSLNNREIAINGHLENNNGLRVIVDAFADLETENIYTCIVQE